MIKRFKSQTTRTKAHILTISLSALFMIVGIAFPVPLVAMEKQIVNNAFAWVGFIGALIAFGIIEGIKAWKGLKNK